jgi:hypothetical protein
VLTVTFYLFPYIILCNLTALCGIELLTDDYVDSLKLKVKSTASSGISYAVEAEQQTAGDDVGGELHFEIPFQGQKLTTKFFTSGKGTAELKLDNTGVRGLNATLLAGIGKDVAVGTLEFKHGPMGVTAAIDYFGLAGDVSLAAAFAPKGYTGFCVFGLVGKVSSEFTREKLDFCVSYYDGEESECTLHVNDKATKGLVSYSHHVRPGFSVAGQFSYDQPKESSLLTMGCAMRMDNSTVVKGKVNSRGELAASYIQEIRAKTKLILSTKFDVTTLDSARVGISLALD